MDGASGWLALRDLMFVDHGGTYILDLYLFLVLCYVFVFGSSMLIIKEVVVSTPISIGYVFYLVKSITADMGCLVRLEFFTPCKCPLFKGFGLGRLG